MHFIALAPAIAAVVLSFGSTPRVVIAIVNVVVSFFAINTMLNLGTQQETGTEAAGFETYKSGAVAALTLTWVVAIVLIVVALA
jgi:hypothetical protein